MPAIRERDPNDFIKSKGKGKRRGRKGSVAPRIDNAVRSEVREHRNKKEESNEYAVGFTEEAAAEVAIEARHLSGNIKRTIQRLHPKTKERVLNEPEPEKREPEETVYVPNTVEKQRWELAEKKAQERADISRSENPPYSNESYTDYTLNQGYIDNPQYTSQHASAPPAEASQQGSSPSGTKAGIKEKLKGNTEPKQKRQHEPRTRSRIEQVSYKINRPTKQAGKATAQKVGNMG